jgi:hypothetical protein
MLSTGAILTVRIQHKKVHRAMGVKPFDTILVTASLMCIAISIKDNQTGFPFTTFVSLKNGNFHGS